MNCREPSISITLLDTSNIFITLGLIMIVCACLVVLFFLCKKAPLLIQQAWGIQDGQSEASTKKKPKMGFFAYIFDILKKSVLTIILFMKTIEVLYYVAYGFAAVLGVLLHPFFFSFHLSEIVLR